MVRTDQEILALGQARDQEAIAAMAEKYGAYCHTVARNVLGNDADAEECVNDAYLAVWNAIPRAQPQNLLAYLAKTTRNIALRRLEHDQAQKRDSRLHLLLDELAEVLPGEGSVEDEAAQGELVEAINTFLKEKATRAERQLFLRRYFWGDSIRDLAPGLPVQREQGEIPPLPGAEAAAGLPGGKGVDGVKGEKLYELLDALDDTLVLESAEVKRTTWRRRLALVAAVVAVIAAVWFFTTEPVRHPREDVGGPDRRDPGRGILRLRRQRRPRPQGGQGPPGPCPLRPRPGEGSAGALPGPPAGHQRPRLGAQRPGTVLHRRGGEPALAARPDHGGGDPPLRGTHPLPRPVGPAGPPPVGRPCWRTSKTPPTTRPSSWTR